MAHYFLIFFLRVLTLVLLCLVPLTAQSDQNADSKIEIIGVPDLIKQNIELHLGIEKDLLPVSSLGFPRSNDFILSKTYQALQAMGYYQPSVRLTGNHQLWNLSITLNNPVVWDKVDVRLLGAGQEFSPLIEIINQHPFETDLVVNHGQYDQFKSRLQSLAIESGFFDTHFETSRLDVDISMSKANIEWILDTGERYVIHEIKFSGSVLSDRLLRRYLYIKPSEFYQHENIIKSQQALNRSGFFNLVTIDRLFDRAKKLVTIILEFEDIEKYEFKTSLGYGTDTGGKIGVSWLDRRFNERGHNYLASLDISQIESSASFQYAIPLEKNKSEWLNRLSYREKDEDLAQSKILTIESRKINQIDEYWSSQWALTLASERISTQAIIEEQLQYLIPSWQINYYSTTDPFSAQSGWRWQSKILATDKFLSDPSISFVQIEQNIKYIWEFKQDWRLLTRAQAAYTQINTQEFNTSMPIDYRYFAGGDVSVRGYQYQSLSPKDINGLPLGGKHQLVTSLELDWRFKPDWRLAVFADQGNAFNDWSDIDLHQSVGTGVRWITPVGSIRLDFARALDAPEEWNWHITIGSDL